MTRPNGIDTNDDLRAVIRWNCGPSLADSDHCRLYPQQAGAPLRVPPAGWRQGSGESASGPLYELLLAVIPPFPAYCALPTPRTLLSSGLGFRVEVGRIPSLLYVDDGRYELRSHNGNEFKSFLALSKSIPAELGAQSALLDGEINRMAEVCAKKRRSALHILTVGTHRERLSLKAPVSVITRQVLADYLSVTVLSISYDVPSLYGILRIRAPHAVVS